MGSPLVSRAYFVIYGYTFRNTYYISHSYYSTGLVFRDINKSKLKHIEPLTFQHLENLEVLNLKRNQIDTLKDGAFYGLKKIGKL